MGEADGLIRKGAEAISRDLAGPAGQIALDRVVVRHLDFFDLCQRRGLSWRQIIAVLHAAGAGRESGLPFAAGHLSAVVWRQRQKLATRTTPPPVSEVTDAPGVDRPATAEAGLKSKPVRPATSRRMTPRLESPSVVPPSAISRAPASPLGRDIRAAVKRAADLRRSSEDAE